MRVVPLAIAYRGDHKRLTAAVRANAETTHPNPEAIAGAEIVAKLIVWLLDQEKSATLDADPLMRAISPTATSKDLEDWKLRLHEAAQGSKDGQTLTQVGVTGWVKHTVPAVVFLLIAHGDNIDAALAELWAAGGDIDTIAALYLSCMGALHGTSALANDLITCVQGREVLHAEATRLHQLQIGPVNSLKA